MAKTNTIITIGRQFGSGGREIGYMAVSYTHLHGIWYMPECRGLSQTILAFSVRSYPVILLFPVKPVLHSRVPHIRTMDYLWDLHPAILAIKRLWH